MKKTIYFLSLITLLSCSGSDDDTTPELISLTIKGVWATDVTSTTVGSSLGITYYALDFGADEKLNVGEQIPGYNVYDDYTYFEDGVWTVSNVTSTKVILAGSPGNVATLTYIDALTLSIDAIIEGETITGNFTSITLFE